MSCDGGTNILWIYHHPSVMIPISRLLTMFKHPFIIVSLIESKKCAAFHEVPLIALLFILVIGHAMMKGAWSVYSPAT